MDVHNNEKKDLEKTREVTYFKFPLNAKIIFDILCLEYFHWLENICLLK